MNNGVARNTHRFEDIESFAEFTTCIPVTDDIEIYGLRFSFSDACKLAGLNPYEQMKF